jgi:hypothetical protein
MSVNFEVPPNHTPLDVGSIVVIVLSALGYMPGVAAALAVVWYAILIYDRIMNGPKRAE